MRKNKVRRGVLAVILLVVAVFFIAGTYSRYSTTGGVNLQTTVAKWDVDIKNGDTSAKSTTINVPFTVADNDYVVANKIAPNSSATATIDLYLENTEVAVDFTATIDTTAITGLSNANVTLTVDADGQANTHYASGETITFGLPSGNAFTAENGTKHITFTLTWANVDSTSTNTADTTNGIAGSAISIPVTLTAQQHISNS